MSRIYPHSYNANQSGLMKQLAASNKSTENFIQTFCLAVRYLSMRLLRIKWVIRKWSVNIFWLDRDTEMHD